MGSEEVYTVWLIEVMTTGCKGDSTLRPKRASMLLLAALALAVSTSGCSRWLGTPDTRNAPGLDAPPPLELDYPGWKLERDNVAVASVMTAVEGGQTRQERAVVLSSPEDDVVLLVTYMRSGGDTSEIAAKPWMTLDTVFSSDGWRDPDAQALYKQAAADHPDELILGAYDVSVTPGESRRVNVGFYGETHVNLPAGTQQISWVRGERVYAKDAAGGWLQVSDDSNSDSCWDVLVPVD